uniref:Sulfate_transp domain-containing protein n=1 Tax=Trichuris muris TaxID=70415 RepID=A0A5S6Q7I3_TRIMR
MTEEAPVVNVHRPAYNLESLDATFGVQYVDLTVCGSVKKLLRKIRDKPCALVKQFVLARFPCILWLAEYNLKKDLLQDVISGVTVGIFNIPQGMAYGILCGVPAIYGLYTSFYPPLFYALFGSSRHIAVGKRYG